MSYLPYTNSNTHKDKDSKTKNIFIVIPYSRGLSQSFKNICGKVGVQFYFKGKG